MLLIKRKPGEAFLIQPADTLDPRTPIQDLFGSGPIKIQIRQINGIQVKVGIRADERFAIIREELTE
jgi:sRNA-binding carbon storage regulator CsrA